MLLYRYAEFFQKGERKMKESGRSQSIAWVVETINRQHKMLSKADTVNKRRYLLRRIRRNSAVLTALLERRDKDYLNLCHIK